MNLLLKNHLIALENITFIRLAASSKRIDFVFKTGIPLLDIYFDTTEEAQLEFDSITKLLLK